MSFQMSFQRTKGLLLAICLFIASVSTQNLSCAVAPTSTPGFQIDHFFVDVSIKFDDGYPEDGGTFTMSGTLSFWLTHLLDNTTAKNCRLEISKSNFNYYGGSELLSIGPEFTPCVPAFPIPAQYITCSDRPTFGFWLLEPPNGFEYQGYISLAVGHTVLDESSYREYVFSSSALVNLASPPFVYNQTEEGYGGATFKTSSAFHMDVPGPVYNQTAPTGWKGDKVSP